MIARSIACVMVVTFATTARAQSPASQIEATGEHRLVSGDTVDSARQLALIDARRKIWSAAVSRLQERADTKTMGLKPIEIEAYTVVILETEEQPAQAASGRQVAQVNLRSRLDGAETVRRMAALRTDQDASFDLIEAWTGIQQLHQQVADQTRRRASASGEDASGILREQQQTITALNVKHLAARASAALARTEQSPVGGRAATSEGRERARQLVEAAIALWPDSPDAHAVMGDVMIDALDPEGAEAEFRKALAAPPDSSSRRTKLAEALRMQGRFDEAVTELREALRVTPGSARAHSGLGLALRAQKSLPDAVTEYREAIRLDPDLIDAHNGLAVVLANQGKLEEAVVEFREIVRIDPDSAIGYYNLAYALADLDRDVESAAALREVIRINPDHYNARYNLGELFRLEAKYDDSVTQFREYLRLAPDTPQNRRNIQRAKDFIQKFADQ